MNSEQLLNEYYANGAEKLHRVVDRILSKFGGIYEKDKDDFYSLANEVMANINRSYDDSQNADVYVYACLSNKIKSEITKRNRVKRRADRDVISIDIRICNQEDITIGDLLVSDFDIENEMSESFKISQMVKLQAYMKMLSERQRRIAKMIMEGYKPYEIRRELGITQKEYNSAIKAMRAYKRAKYLRRTGM